MANRTFRIGRRAGVMLLAAAALAAALLAAAMLTSPTPAGAAYPGKNGKIAFERGEDIWTMNPDGSGPARLTHDPAQDGSPVFSPDGAKIAFISYRDGNAEVYLMNADGSDETNLTRNPAQDGGSGYFPEDEAPAVWSPDGQGIAFESTRDGNREVYAMNPDGSDQVNLSKNAQARDHSPTFSPGGEELAFVSHDGSIGDIYVANSDTPGEPRKITDLKALAAMNECTEAYAADLAWRPASREIGFLLWVCPSETGYASSIYAVGRDGSGLRQIPNTDYRPKDFEWSPDGKRIAFTEIVSPADAFSPIYAMEADGSGKTELSRGVYDSTSGPTWSPDGTKVAFHSQGADDYHRGAIWLASADGSGEPTKLSDESTSRSYYYTHLDWQPLPTDTGPTITSPKPAPGSKIRDRTPTIQATVGDQTSALTKADVKLHVDGRRKGFSYDPEADRLRRTAGRLSSGKHTVKIVATDEAGNTATKQWSFKVARRS